MTPTTRATKAQIPTARIGQRPALAADVEEEDGGGEDRDDDEQSSSAGRRACTSV